MVVPWVGFPLHKLLALVEPTSNARYVAFKTLYAPEQMLDKKIASSAAAWPIPMSKGCALMKRCTRSR